MSNPDYAEPGPVQDAREWIDALNAVKAERDKAREALVEALHAAARNRRLRSDKEKCRRSWEGRAAKAEARVAELEAALNKIAAWGDGRTNEDWDPGRDEPVAAKIARLALRGEVEP